MAKGRNSSYYSSINGNYRAVFEYFLGYKLGLTATPKDYIKNVDIDKLKSTDPRAWEKRQLLDSYKTFMENAKRDPITGEIGKSIIFCVSRIHAAKITQILNEFADKLFPDKYYSDFAMQITSDIMNAQIYTINFQNNNLSGTTKFLENYKSSKTRVCVTVGMMTTGYDCEDLLNIVLMRPIFSPTDFIQIKGRGTRKYEFSYKEKVGAEVREHTTNKETFKLFDFFGNCEYFEEKFDYDEVITLPKPQSKGGDTGTPPVRDGLYENFDPDPLKFVKETAIGLKGMEFGGSREFFKEEYEKYAWTNIMQPENSGQQRANLYSEVPMFPIVTQKPLICF